MVLMAGYDLPMRAIRQQIASAVDLIVHLERLTDGTRRVVAITEVLRTEGEVITTQDLFTFRVDEVTGDGTVMGGLVHTGLRPTFVHKLEKRGVELPASMAGGKPAGGLQPLAGGVAV
jgi:pilus assembly protein CpaF